MVVASENGHLACSRHWAAGCCACHACRKMLGAYEALPHAWPSSALGKAHVAQPTHADLVACSHASPLHHALAPHLAVKNRWAALCKRTQKIQRNTVGSRSRRGARAAAEEEDEEDEDTPEPPSIINGMLPSPRASPRLHGHRGAQSMQGFPPLHDQGGHMQMHHMQGMHHHNMHHHVMHHQQNMGMASGLDAAYAGTGSSLKRGASGHNLHDQQQPAPKRRHLDVQVPQPQYHHMQAPNSGGSGGARTPRGRSAAAATSSQYLGMGGGGGAGGLGSSGSGPLSPRSAAALVVSGMPLGSAGSGAAGGGAGPSSAPPTTSPPGGKGKRPDLTLHIPNPAAADPAPMQQQNGSSAVEIRVSKVGGPGCGSVKGSYMRGI